MKKVLTSSSGSGNLSLTIKGLLLALVPVIISIAKTQGIEVAESDVVNIINNIFTIASLIAVVIGLVRKIYLSRWSA
jgi:uncharacterized membrane protein